ncbi:MAG: hypothetical protein KC589_03590 [Nanoarchaeota archaeon]|nr:hypothetical protein [Nanoarchaeota archaeon]
MLIKNLILIGLVMFSAILGTSVFAVSDSQLTYVYFLVDESDSSNMNKVIYKLEHGDIDLDGKVFSMEFYYQGELNSKKCLVNLDSNFDLFQKITCEVPKLGDGDYYFDAKILDGENFNLENLFNREYLLGEISASIDFEDNTQLEKTTIVLNIVGEGKNLLVENFIPKEVISYLDDNNKDELIESSFEYKILNPDPLIAWNIEKAPARINYTINKKVSEEDKENFRVELKESKSFQWLKYLLIVLMILLLFAIFKPLNKNKKLKKNN